MSGSSLGETFEEVAGRGVRSDAVALVIGIGRYTDPQIPNLPFAVADAQAFKDVLVDPERGRLDPDNVRLLDESESTLAGIKQAIGVWLRDQVGKHPNREATAIIYFCGHGECEVDPLGRESDGYAKYLLPVDANARELWTTGLPSTAFTDLLAGVKAKRLVIFLDACFAGAVAEAAGATPRGNLPVDLDISDDLQKRLQGQEGSVIISAARSNQRSYEHQSLRHGIFTHHLIEALSAKADFDGDGYIGVRDVYRYLDKNVPETAERLCKQVQKPIMNPPLETAPDFILAVDVSRLSEIRRNQRKMALSRLYKSDLLTDEEFGEVLTFLQAAGPMSAYERVIAEHLFPVLDNPDTLRPGAIETYRAIRKIERGRESAQRPKQDVPLLPIPEPTLSLKEPLISEPTRPSWLVSVKRLPWNKIASSMFYTLFFGTIGVAVLYGWLYSPRVDIVAKDLDWETRNPSVGQVIVFTGHFSTSYRIRQGLSWNRAEVEGMDLALVFTATWSVNGRPTEVEDPRKVKTGETVATRFEFKFEQPGEYRIGFSINSNRGDDDPANSSIMRTILVLPPPAANRADEERPRLAGDARDERSVGALPDGGRSLVLPIQH